MKDVLCGCEITHDGEFNLSIFHKQQICNSLSVGFKDGEAGFGDGKISWEITKTKICTAEEFCDEISTIYPVIDMRTLRGIVSLARSLRYRKILPVIELERVFMWVTMKKKEMDVFSLKAAGEVQEYLLVVIKDKDFKENMTRKKLAHMLNILHPYMERPYGCSMTKIRQIKHLEHWMKIHNYLS